MRLLLATLSLLMWFQAPSDPSKAPKQLPVERQNAILKLELHQQGIQSDFNQCNARLQNAQKDYQDDQAKIDKETEAGLKELGLDPAKYIVQPNTFYVAEKPPVTPTPASAKEAAKK